MSKMNNLERPQGGSEDVEDDVTPAPLAHGQSPFGQLVRRVAATSLIYTLGTFGLRFASFLLIPLYWRFLDPADYGLLAVTEIFKTFLSVFLGLGIADSITRFFHAWPETERRERLGSIWILDWGS
jgi:O-antigen/teichoic acid export membrane protein